jgi:hypothetical protein
LIVDEAGSIPDVVYRTRVLRMTASSAAMGKEPSLILIGTPHVLNHFYESWMDDSFFKVRVTWEEGVKAGILDKKEVEDSKKIMSEAEFKMWYGAEFVSGEGSLFDRKMVKEVMLGSKDKEPIDGYEYVGGLDVARFGSDESAFVVLKYPKGVSLDDTIVEMCYASCRSKQALTDIIGWAKELTERWRLKYLAVDEVGLGAGVYDMLKEKLGDVVKGVSSIGHERVEIYLNLQNMIEDKKLILLKDDKLEYQFGSFNMSYMSDGRVRITKNPRMRDDLIDALAYACNLLKVEKEGEVTLSEEIMRSL